MTPTPGFFAYLNRAVQAPSVMALITDDGSGGLDFTAYDAFLDRCRAGSDLEDLAPADQELLRQAQREVSAGLSPNMPDADGSDWAAEDADDDEGPPRPAPQVKGWAGL